MIRSSVFTPGALLTGRRALVTGGASGIGAAIARAFAAHGAHVLVTDLYFGNPLDFDPGSDGAITTLEHDVRTDSPDPLLEHRPDILVNNVGHYLCPPRPFTDNAPDLWAELHEINLGHVLRLTHAVLPGMNERGRGGSIVNLTTVEAHRAMPGHTIYSAYKAALMQFTRSLAAEVGPSGIRVNALAPDLIETVQVPYTDLVPERDLPLWPSWSPLGGPGQPEDVAGAALFLASDLSRFVTGGTIHVDGGTHGAGGWVPRASGGWTNRPRNP